MLRTPSPPLVPQMGSINECCCRSLQLQGATVHSKPNQIQIHFYSSESRICIPKCTSSSETSLCKERSSYRTLAHSVTCSHTYSYTRKRCTSMNKPHTLISVDYYYYLIFPFILLYEFCELESTPSYYHKQHKCRVLRAASVE